MSSGPGPDHRPGERFRYRRLAVAGAGDLVFGRAPRPLACGFGLTIGAGAVFPEVNFTLPPLAIDDSSWPAIVDRYRSVTAAVIERALALAVPGLVLELELLPPMTARPEWGAQLTSVMREALGRARETDGLPSALRVTPVDLRLSQRPPRLRAGPGWEATIASLRACADAGAHILSIESEGGKEVADEALLRGDARGIALALGVLGCRDMAFLWDAIVDVCRSTAALPGGDSACAFGNTAMQLAGQRLLPETFAAVVRAMTAARSLVAFERGAVGPSKDCAYEGPVLKAITGCPISMEGKTAAGAHFSPLGNIAAACCDLWSNESVQDVRLLSGSAPEAFTDMLAYDCRLLNAALARGEERHLRDLLVASDRDLSPQALVLAPEPAVRIATAIVSQQDDYARTVAAGRVAVEIIGEAAAEGRLRLSKAETRWLGRIEQGLGELPVNEGDLLEQTQADYGHLYDRDAYAL